MLRLVVKQSFVANVVALSEAMAMTDASKRRGEAVEDSASSQEIVPVEKIRAQAKPILPKAKSISKGSADGYSSEEHRMVFLFHRVDRC